MLSVGQWREANVGIYGGPVTALVSSGSRIFAGTQGGIFLSNDNANTWERVARNLENGYITAMAVTSRGIIAASTRGARQLYLSSSPYSDWATMNAGLPDQPILSVSSIGEHLACLTGSGELYVLTAGADQWIQVGTQLGVVNALAASQGRIYAATENGVFVTADLGVTWSAINNGLLDKSIYSLAAHDNFLIASARVGITFFSRDGGTSWSLSTLEAGRYKLRQFNGIWLAANQDRVFFSTNQGAMWDQVRLLPGGVDFAVTGAALITGNFTGVYLSSDGIRWSARNGIGLANAQIVQFASSSDRIFCATASNVYRSLDIGKTWFSISRGLPLDQVTALGYYPGKLFVALSNYGIYRSDNDGATWQLAAGISRINDFESIGSEFFAAGAGGLYRSIDGGRNWARVLNAPANIHDLFAYDGKLLAVSREAGISYSADSGLTWQPMNQGLALPFAVNQLGSFAERLYLATRAQTPILVWSGSPPQWIEEFSSADWGSQMRAFSSDEADIFSAGGSGVFRKSAEVWAGFFNEQFPKLSLSEGILALRIHRNHLFAGTRGSGVWISCIAPPRPVLSYQVSATGDSVLVSDSESGNQWFLDGEQIANESNPVLIPRKSGVYTLKVALNGCESELSNELNVVVVEYPDANIIMPNVFTPDGDEFNPLFVPIQFDFAVSASLEVIDRWGNRIFFTNDVTKGWDGGSARSGLYYYRIRYVGKNEKSGERGGWVSLIR